jgi:hypothetical protein
MKLLVKFQRVGLKLLATEFKDYKIMRHTMLIYGSPGVKILNPKMLGLL